MDKLKSYVQRNLPSDVKSIVTFADNRATKFFEKNDFVIVPKNEAIELKK